MVALCVLHEQQQLDVHVVCVCVCVCECAHPNPNNTYTHIMAVIMYNFNETVNANPVDSCQRCFYWSTAANRCREPKKYTRTHTHHLSCCSRMGSHTLAFGVAAHNGTSLVLGNKPNSIRWPIFAYPGKQRVRWADTRKHWRFFLQKNIVMVFFYLFVCVHGDSLEMSFESA